jgi:hypothetical protein
VIDVPVHRREVCGGHATAIASISKSHSSAEMSAMMTVMAGVWSPRTSARMRAFSARWRRSAR